MRTVLVAAHQLGPYVEGLRALERGITYPLAGGADRFWIDHGPDYHPFFSSLGETHFLIALDDRDRVVGTAAGILRDARHGDRRVRSGYACDLKVDPAHRGGAVARSMLRFGLWKMLTTPRFRAWRYAYAAAMRGARGDVMRSVRGLHPARLFSPAATLALYFVPAEHLARLPDGGPRTPPLDAGLDLSPAADASTSTAGRKDLRRTKGDPWPLVHLSRGPAGWGPGWGHYLRTTAASLPAGTVTCFGVDARLADHVAWLETEAGLRSDTVCTIYAWRLPGAPRAPAWIHLATSEI